MGGDYLRIPRHLLRSAFFPHCGCPRPPWNDGILSRAHARKWICPEINGPIASDSWIHRSRLPRIQSTLRCVILEWAWCDYPLYLPPRLIAQFASAVAAISNFCMSLKGWDLLPPTPRADQVTKYYDAVHWNQDDDRRRAARQGIKFDTDETELVYGKGGIPLDFPSGMGVRVPSVPL